MVSASTATFLHPFYKGGMFGKADARCPLFDAVCLRLQLLVREALSEQPQSLKNENIEAAELVPLPSEPEMTRYAVCLPPSLSLAPAS